MRMSKDDSDLRCSLWSDAISGRVYGPSRSGSPSRQQVVIRSDRGTELGEVLCLASDRTAKFLPNPVQGEILRLATLKIGTNKHDMAEDQRNSSPLARS